MALAKHHPRPGVVVGSELVGKASLFERADDLHDLVGWHGVWLADEPSVRERPSELLDAERQSPVALGVKLTPMARGPSARCCNGLLGNYLGHGSLRGSGGSRGGLYASRPLFYARTEAA